MICLLINYYNLRKKNLYFLYFYIEIFLRRSTESKNGHDYQALFNTCKGYEKQDRKQ